jgi:hypothetical protein
MMVVPGFRQATVSSVVGCRPFLPADGMGHEADSPSMLFETGPPAICRIERPLAHNRACKVTLGPVNTEGTSLDKLYHSKPVSRRLPLRGGRHSWILRGNSRVFWTVASATASASPSRRAEAGSHACTCEHAGAWGRAGAAKSNVKRSRRQGLSHLPRHPRRLRLSRLRPLPSPSASSPMTETTRFWCMQLTVISSESGQWSTRLTCRSPKW